MARLGLSSKGFLVSGMAQINYEDIECLPGDSEPSHIFIAFYAVHPTSRGWDEIAAIVEQRWLSASELLDGQTNDEELVLPHLTYWLRKLEVIQPWSSTVL